MTFGAWLVMNKDTYLGGSTHSDLTVDGITYNYMGMFQVPNEGNKNLLLICTSLKPSWCRNLNYHGWVRSYHWTCQYLVSCLKEDFTDHSSSNITTSAKVPQEHQWKPSFKKPENSTAQHGNLAFYDSIAKFVLNYVSSSRRAAWKAHVDLPIGAKHPIAILS